MKAIVTYRKDMQNLVIHARVTLVRTREDDPLEAVVCWCGSSTREVTAPPDKIEKEVDNLLKQPMELVKKWRAMNLPDTREIEF